MNETTTTTAAQIAQDARYYGPEVGNPNGTAEEVARWHAFHSYLENAAEADSAEWVAASDAATIYAGAVAQADCWLDYVNHDDLAAETAAATAATTTEIVRGLWRLHAGAVESADWTYADKLLRAADAITEREPQIVTDSAPTDADPAPEHATNETIAAVAAHAKQYQTERSGAEPAGADGPSAEYLADEAAGRYSDDAKGHHDARADMNADRAAAVAEWREL